MKWGETAHCGGFDWKKSPPETVLDVHLCLSGGKFELDPREGRGMGGGPNGVSPGLHQATTCISVAQTPQTQILGCQLFGEMEGTEHFGNTSFPHLHLEQIGWKHSGLGPELDLSFGRRPFFFFRFSYQRPRGSKARGPHQFVPSVLARLASGLLTGHDSVSPEPLLSLTTTPWAPAVGFPVFYNSPPCGWKIIFFGRSLSLDLPR